MLGEIHGSVSGGRIAVLLPIALHTVSYGIKFTVAPPSSWKRTSSFPIWGLANNRFWKFLSSHKAKISLSSPSSHLHAASIDFDWHTIKDGADISGVFTIGADSSTIGNHRLPSTSAGQSVPIVKNYDTIIFDVYIDNFWCRKCFHSAWWPVGRQTHERQCVGDRKILLAVYNLQICRPDVPASWAEWRNMSNFYTKGDTNFSRFMWWQTAVAIFIV